MAQQAAMALGAAAATSFLHLSRIGRGGGALSGGDFSAALFACAACALLGAGLMLRLPHDAGGDVSGHTPRQRISAR